MKATASRTLLAQPTYQAARQWCARVTRATERRRSKEAETLVAVEDNVLTQASFPSEHRPRLLDQPGATAKPGGIAPDECGRPLPQVLCGSSVCWIDSDRGSRVFLGLYGGASAKNRSGRSTMRRAGSRRSLARCD